MPTTHSNQPHRRRLHFKYTAEWRWVDVRPSASPAAAPFGPPFDLKSDEQEPAGGCPTPKPVLYMPVKRQEMKEIVPSLGIFVSFWEQGTLQNVAVPAHRGRSLKVTVFNVWGGHEKGAVSFDGVLDDRGCCFIRIRSTIVMDWLDPERGKVLGGRINELLLDFRFACPDLNVDGKPLKGQSLNRVFLYRRKVIVFLPGVFGSQIKLRTPDGRTVGFPDYYDEPSTFGRIMELVSPGHAIVRQTWSFLNQQVGGLECDAAGRPLLSPVKATLLRLLGKVYDVYDNCRAARIRYFAGVPKEFRLVELQLFAYDWRGDLTETAQALAKSLTKLREEGPAALHKLPDYDDEIALAGHSTGGLIIRRALGEPGMQEVVSHALFLNVPFRGAPKALGVILTGEDPPGGARMIPFVDADSLRALALGMPIVYHLAPSAAYDDRVAYTPNRPRTAAPSIEDDKRDLIAAAIEIGFMAPPRFVKAFGLSPEDRALLAATADKWHQYWAEAFERYRAQDLYEAVYPTGHPKRDGWFTDELRSRGLEAQFAARFVGGWNTELAERARRFHEESEEVARSGHWKAKAFVFYSVVEEPTTLRIHLDRVGHADFPGLASFLDAEGVPIRSLADGAIAPHRRKEQHSVAKERTVPALITHQWTATPGRFRRTIWRIHGDNEGKAGDGTVPTASLVGFGGPAKLLKPIPEGPSHADATKNDFVWDRIMEILQGTLSENVVDARADLVKGKAGS